MVKIRDKDIEKFITRENVEETINHYTYLKEIAKREIDLTKAITCLKGLRVLLMALGGHNDETISRKMIITRENVGNLQRQAMNRVAIHMREKIHLQKIRDAELFTGG